MSIMSAEVVRELDEMGEHLQGRFSNLEIQHLIARGGMGAVYRAVQTQLDRHVALKILPDEFSIDEVRRNLFVSEARAMAKLSHPHLVQLFDFGENDGVWYMVQEWVNGKTLYDHQKAGILEIDDGVRLVREVLSGLQHAHVNGVVHRDIKPANILIDQDGAVKLTDFGLAQSVGAEAVEQEDTFGTPEYAAPELFETGATIDHRADIFAVGVLLYELLTGQRPATTYRPPSKVVEDLGTGFDAMISKAMQADPDNRYDSCAEFDQDLYGALTGTGAKHARSNKPKVLTGAVTTRVPNMNLAGISPLSSAKSGGGAGVFFGILTILGLVVGGVIFLSKRDQSDPETPREQLASEIKKPEETPPPPPPAPGSVVKKEEPAKQSINSASSIEPTSTAKKAPKTKKKKKKKASGPIHELTAIEKEVMAKAPALIAEYDSKMKMLQERYLTVCKKESVKNNGKHLKFWTEEALHIKKHIGPPKKDDRISERALTLRVSWRERELSELQPLKLLHRDIQERYDLLMKEFHRENKMRKRRKVQERAIAMQSFDFFLKNCRQKIGQE